MKKKKNSGSGPSNSLKPYIRTSRCHYLFDSTLPYMKMKQQSRQEVCRETQSITYPHYKVFVNDIRVHFLWMCLFTPYIFNKIEIQEYTKKGEALCSRKEIKQCNFQFAASKSKHKLWTLHSTKWISNKNKMNRVKSKPR